MKVEGGRAGRFDRLSSVDRMFLSLVVTADARAFPDLDVLMAGMERDWEALIGPRHPELIEHGVPAAEVAVGER